MKLRIHPVLLSQSYFQSSRAYFWRKTVFSTVLPDLLEKAPISFPLPMGRILGLYTRRMIRPHNPHHILPDPVPVLIGGHIQLLQLFLKPLHIELDGLSDMN